MIQPIRPRASSTRHPALAVALVITLIAFGPGGCSESTNSTDGSSAPDRATGEGGGASAGASSESGSSGELAPTGNAFEGPIACTGSADAIRERALTLINAARAEARTCGTERFEATAAVRWNAPLYDAALAHSADMAEHNFFSHTGSSGSTLSQRVTATGYAWRRVGENIAAGQSSVSAAVAGWIASPGHCRNLMNPSFTDIALACVEDGDTDFTRYWTNVLATGAE